jgi:YesN/AraC family two-component response regulator
MVKVLLVEDDPQVRFMLRETLQQEGYDVREAINGKEGLALFRESPADLVITDIIMPEKDGVEAIHALRREAPEVKIIAISGGSANINGDHLLKTASKLGASRTFGKPVDMAELLEAVQEIVHSD